MSFLLHVIVDVFDESLCLFASSDDDECIVSWWDDVVVLFVIDGHAAP